LGSGSGIDKDDEEEVSAFEELKKAVPELRDVRDGRERDAKEPRIDTLSMVSSYTNTMPTLTICK
jgi:hypothetical protein